MKLLPLFAVLLLAGCTTVSLPPSPGAAPVDSVGTIALDFTTRATALEQAGRHAKRIGASVVHFVDRTGDMAPLLVGDCFLVVLPTKYEALAVDAVVLAQWDISPSMTPPLPCRIIMKDVGGWTAVSERNRDRRALRVPTMRVTPSNYVAQVIAIYRCQ